MGKDNVQNDVVVVDNTTIKCVKCGAQLSEGDSFCSKCGEKVTISKTSPLLKKAAFKVVEKVVVPVANNVTNKVVTEVISPAVDKAADVVIEKVIVPTVEKVSKSVKNKVTSALFKKDQNK